VFYPDLLALQGELGDALDLLVGRDVEELFFSFRDDLEAVAAALELLAEGADELALGVEDEDGSVRFSRPSWMT
jgi:hypothetical protein